VQPVANTHYLIPAERNARIEVEFNRPPGVSVWFQVANDPEFQSVVTHESTVDPKTIREFPPGQYFIRAKSDFGEGHETAWTDPVPFVVDRKFEKLDLNQAPLQTRVLIPNQPYPEAMYKADPEVVKEFLAKKGLLGDFFVFPRESYDEIHLQFSTSTKIQTQNDGAWPKGKLRPGRYQYKYQTTKKGYQPSNWSDPKNLEIAMEPPKPDGDIQYGTTAANGESEARWKMTPILYAGSYDVEISHDPYMRSARELRVTEPIVKAPLNGENYWRARARDPQGRIISDFSPIYKLKPNVPVYLAKNPPPPEPPARKPAAVEREQTRVDRSIEEPIVKAGWWAWFGLGENYVDYRQSANGNVSIEDSHLKGPSQYLEVGFLAQNTWGGIFTAKQTPGEINPTLKDGETLDSTSYKWQTLSFEGIRQKASPFSLFGTPVIYGLRLGIQQHEVPFIYVDSSGDLHMRSNTLTMASAGILAEWSRKRWTYYWLMRYQYPLTSQASGGAFSINPVFAFDGSVGTSYNITQQLKAGLFWYGQWHQYNFTYAGEDQTNTGFQSLFYSNVDLRLGYDF